MDTSDCQGLHVDLDQFLVMSSVASRYSPGTPRCCTRLPYILQPGAWANMDHNMLQMHSVAQHMTQSKHWCPELQPPSASTTAWQSYLHSQSLGKVPFSSTTERMKALRAAMARGWVRLPTAASIQQAHHIAQVSMSTVSVHAGRSMHYLAVVVEQTVSMHCTPCFVGALRHLLTLFLFSVPRGRKPTGWPHMQIEAA
jgi:hypothetical protein